LDVNKFLRSLVVTRVYARSLSDDRMGIRRLCRVTHGVPPAPDIPITGPISACVRPSDPPALADRRCRACNTLGHRLRWPPAAGNRQQITLRRRPICWRRDYVTSRIARLREVSTDGSRRIDPAHTPAAAAAAAAVVLRHYTAPQRRCDQCLLGVVVGPMSGFDGGVQRLPVW